MREFKTCEERDAFLEASYHYDRKGYNSTLAYVSGEQKELVRDFWHAWDGNGDAQAALLGFELNHFGAALETVAHQMLWYAVRASMRTGIPEQRRAKVPPRNEGEGAEHYIRRIAVANGWMKPGAEAVREMPEAAADPVERTA